MKLQLFVLCLARVATSETLHFTNQDPKQDKNYSTYQLDLPGSRPITIYEAESPYSYNRRVSTGPVQSIDTKPVALTIKNTGSKKVVHTPSLLEKFLQTYQKQTEHHEVEETTASEAIEMTDAEDNQGRRNRPHQGWVSLEAVPTYTSAKVYKWNSANRPTRPQTSYSQWDDDDYSPERPHRPSHYDDFNDDQGYQVPPKPFGSIYPNPNKYKPFNEKPSYAKPEYERPSYNKPSYGKPDYGRPDYDNRPGDYPKPFNSYDFDDRYSIKKPWNDVITDNRPSNFPEPPQALYNRRKDHPESYPGHGEGQWVLVSTTNGQGIAGGQSQGYRNRQKGSRSMTPETASVSTVLHVIPNKDSVKVTAHNGEMIEVGGNSRKAKELRAKRAKKERQVTLVEKAPDAAGPVFAAVGAGLIPATLSLVAPMVLGRRRRDLDFSPQTVMLQGLQ